MDPKVSKIHHIQWIKENNYDGGFAPLLIAICREDNGSTSLRLWRVKGSKAVQESCMEIDWLSEGEKATDLVGHPSFPMATMVITEKDSPCRNSIVLVQIVSL